MKLPRWVSSVLRNRTSKLRSERAEVRLRVLNVTRQTVLADSLEVADYAAKRNKGLLGRKGLAPGEGMWIVPCESVHTIGMQFPIDLVYLDRKHRIRKVRSDVPPWRMSGCLTAHSVIELPAGTIRATKTGTGDLLEFAEVSMPIEDGNFAFTRAATSTAELAQ